MAVPFMLLRTVFGYALRKIACSGPAGGPSGRALARATRLRGLPTKTGGKGGGSGDKGGIAKGKGR